MIPEHSRPGWYAVIALGTVEENGNGGLGETTRTQMISSVAR